MTNEDTYIDTKDTNMGPREEDTIQLVLELKPYGHPNVKGVNTFVRERKVSLNLFNPF